MAEASLQLEPVPAVDATPAVARRSGPRRRPPVLAAAADDDLRARYARETAATVCDQLRWAVIVFLLTYAAVALFEVQQSPGRLLPYVLIYLLGAAWCTIALLLTSAPTVSPRRSLAVTTLLGVALIANTTTYHVVTRGEAEVLALGNLYLVIGFLTAFPWGPWPQLVVAVAGCLGLVVGLLTTVDASVSSGILVSGMVSLGGLSVAAALITDRSRYHLFVARDQLKRAKEAAEAASRARRDFVASVSHDLRTPVNIIFGMADMALDVAVTDEQRDFVQTIKRSAGQLNALITDLLDFSKIDAGVVALRPRRFALRPWLDQVLEPHAATAAEKGVALRVTVDEALADTIHGDADRLAQVLGNLAGNAVKFTAAGTIAVRLDALATGLRFEVADTGIGIDPRELPRLFQPFVQASATTTSHAGTGLGLAICRRLVEQMGGTIGVKSTPGRGSTFWFSVPLGER